MDDDLTGLAIGQRYELLKPVLDERQRRLWAAAEALVLGTGGVSIVSTVTGLARATIRTGIDELRNPEVGFAATPVKGRVRRPGAGRKTVVEQDETLEQDLYALLESSQDERHPLDWTCKSLRTLADELALHGHRVSYRTLGNLLHRMGYDFSPSETYKQYSIENRRQQYRLISRRASWFLEKGYPIISLRLSEPAVEIGMKELQPVRPEGRTAELATSTLRHWWRHGGGRKYPRAGRLLVLTDTSGLPAGDRVIWEPLLEPLANEAGLEIVAAHFPPGTRRWRRTSRELTCSCSRPCQSEAGEALTVDLDLVLPPEDEIPEQLSVHRGLEEPAGDGWNYRIEGQPKSSAG